MKLSIINDKIKCNYLADIVSYIDLSLSPSSILAYIFCENMTNSGDWMIVISMVAEKRDYRIFRRTIFPFSESLRNTRRAAKKVHSREFANLNGLIYWKRINFDEVWQAKLNDGAEGREENAQG